VLCRLHGHFSGTTYSPTRSPPASCTGHPATLRFVTTTLRRRALEIDTFSRYLMNRNYRWRGRAFSIDFGVGRGGWSRCRESVAAFLPRVIGDHAWVGFVERQSVARFGASPDPGLSSRDAGWTSHIAVSPLLEVWLNPLCSGMGPLPLVVTDVPLPFFDY
jgi:hypothetical protein